MDGALAGGVVAGDTGGVELCEEIVEVPLWPAASDEVGDGAANFFLRCSHIQISQSFEYRMSLFSQKRFTVGARPL